MSDNCTLLLWRLCHRELADHLEQCVEKPLVIEGDRDRWSRIEAKIDQDTLIFNALVWEAPMDKFSKITLGMNTWLRKALNDPMGGSEIAQRVSRVEMLVGVVAPDGFTPEMEEVVFGACKAFDGYVFTGSEILDASATVLASEG